MKVDFPAPFGPSSPVMPGDTSSVTSFRPMTWPYHFETWSALMTTWRPPHATTSTPRTRRSRMTADSATTAASTANDTGHGVA